MDGLPTNKKPVRQPGQRDNVGLDNYLFERKLQEVYDKKKPSDDSPKPIQKFKALFKKKPKQVSVQSRQKVARKQRKKTQLIDAPYIAPKRPQPTVVAVKTRKKHRVRIHKKLRLQHAAVGVFVFAAALAITTTPPQKTTGVLGDTSQVKDVAQKPDFTVLAPTNNPTVQSKIKFDPTRRVASYVDTLGGANLVINQQKLGETELKDSEFLRRTSLNFNLNKELTTKKGQAFMGENKDKNTLFSFFIYNDFLFLIQSDKIIKYQDVVEYIDSLQ